MSTPQVIHWALTFGMSERRQISFHRLASCLFCRGLTIITLGKAANREARAVTFKFEIPGNFRFRTSASVILGRIEQPQTGYLGGCVSYHDRVIVFVGTAFRVDTTKFVLCSYRYSISAKRLRVTKEIRSSMLHHGRSSCAVR